MTEVLGVYWAAYSCIGTVLFTNVELSWLFSVGISCYHLGPFLTILGVELTVSQEALIVRVPTLPYVVEVQCCCTIPTKALPYVVEVQCCCTITTKALPYVVEVQCCCTITTKALPYVVEVQCCCTITTKALPYVVEVQCCCTITYYY